MNQETWTGIFQSSTVTSSDCSVKVLYMCFKTRTLCFLLFLQTGDDFRDVCSYAVVDLRTFPIIARQRRDFPAVSFVIDSQSLALKFLSLTLRKSWHELSKVINSIWYSELWSDKWNLLSTSDEHFDCCCGIFKQNIEIFYLRFLISS